MSDKAKSKSFRTSIGGQALIEGIMMRGPKKQAIVCRTADGLVEKTEELRFIKDRYPILGWPLIRGCAIFLSSLVKGMQLLQLDLSRLDVNMFSAMNNSLINDGCGLYRGRLILPYEHLSRFQNDLID